MLLPLLLHPSRGAFHVTTEFGAGDGIAILVNNFTVERNWLPILLTCMFVELNSPLCHSRSWKLLLWGSDPHMSSPGIWCVAANPVRFPETRPSALDRASAA